MRLFIKEHMGLLLLHGIQYALISLILLLSGFREYAILLYALLISFVFLCAYLVIHYVNRRHVYRKLSTGASDLQELLETTGNSALATELDHLMKMQYQFFMSRLKEVEDDQANYLTFIDRWVHQMKTPLSVIELSAKELDEPESSNLREEVDRIKKGLHTVLYMARMRTIEEDFHIKPVNVESIVREVNAHNKRFFIRNDVYPRLETTQRARVETDEKWLFFIVDQLLHNAVKYTAGKSKRVDIHIGQRAGCAILEVTDFGVGIPLHDQRRLFQAFFTGDNGRIFRESTGMGLYLTKEVADYLGHTIEVESQVDVGTTFRVCFTEAQTFHENLTTM